MIGALLDRHPKVANWIYGFTPPERGTVTLVHRRVYIVPIGYRKNEAVKNAAEELYGKLQEMGVDVLLEDREERPGVLFADMDLIGIPHRIVVGERGLAAGNAEYKARRDEKATAVPLAEVVPMLLKKLA